MSEGSKIFTNIINSKTPSEDLDNLDKMGILEKVLPELYELKGVDSKNNIKHKDNYIHTLRVIKNTRELTSNPWLICVAVLHDIGKAKTKRFDKKHGWSFHHHEEIGADMLLSIFERFDLDMSKFDYVRKLVLLHGHIKVLATPDVSDAALRRFMLDVGDDLDDLLLFSKCDITTKYEEKRIGYINDIERLREKILQLEEEDKIRLFEPPITGLDIMEYFNIKAGREVGIIKKQLKDEILSGVLENDRLKVFNRMIEIGENIIKTN